MWILFLNSDFKFRIIDAIFYLLIPQITFISHCLLYSFISLWAWSVSGAFEPQKNTYLPIIQVSCFFDFFLPPNTCIVSSGTHHALTVLDIAPNFLWHGINLDHQLVFTNLLPSFILRLQIQSLYDHIVGNYLF